MATLSQTEIIKKLILKELRLFTIADFKRFFAIAKDNTAYKIIERLESKGVLKKLTKKRYLFTLSGADDFQIANFLYSPSYISLESALCLYEIISQFPYQITSITPKKTKTIKALEKDFTYFHIKQSLFFGFEKKENFLIALPEKALIDYLYFASKGLRNFEQDNFDLKRINKKTFSEFLEIAKDKNLFTFAKKTGLC